MEKTGNFVLSSSSLRCFVAEKVELNGLRFQVPQLRELSLRECKDVNDRMVLEAAANCPLLESVDLSRCGNVSSQCIPALMESSGSLHGLFVSQCAWIERASIRSDSITDLDFTSCSNLLFLSLDSPSLARLLLAWTTNLRTLSIVAPNLQHLVKPNPPLSFHFISFHYFILMLKHLRFIIYFGCAEHGGMQFNWSDGIAFGTASRIGIAGTVPIAIDFDELPRTAAVNFHKMWNDYGGDDQWNSIQVSETGAVVIVGLQEHQQVDLGRKNTRLDIDRTPKFVSPAIAMPALAEPQHSLVWKDQRSVNPSTPPSPFFFFSVHFLLLLFVDLMWKDSMLVELMAKHPAIGRLHIRGCPGVKELQWTGPNLSDLCLENCLNLNRLDLDCPNLYRLSLRACKLKFCRLKCPFLKVLPFPRCSRSSLLLLRFLLSLVLCVAELVVVSR
jgi:hypothetical protein